MVLISHPDHPPRAISGVRAEATRDGASLRLRFAITGAWKTLRWARGQGRTDELWRNTCFEAFVAGPEAGYAEFNFAPSGAWAAYRFDAYRAGMRDAEAEPAIEWRSGVMRAEVAVPIADDWQLNLTAVIEEADGTKSYWALAHPDGPPDFHDPACFVLALPAPA